MPSGENVAVFEWICRFLVGFFPVVVCRDLTAFVKWFEKTWIFNPFGGEGFVEQNGPPGYEWRLTSSSQGPEINESGGHLLRKRGYNSEILLLHTLVIPGSNPSARHSPKKINITLKIQKSSVSIPIPKCSDEAAFRFLAIHQRFLKRSLKNKWGLFD